MVSSILGPSAVVQGIGQLELYNLPYKDLYSGTGFLISTIISQSVGGDDGSDGGGLHGGAPAGDGSGHNHGMHADWMHFST